MHREQMCQDQAFLNHLLDFNFARSSAAIAPPAAIRAALAAFVKNPTI